MKVKLLVVLVLIASVLAGCKHPSDTERWENLMAKFDVAVQTIVVQNQIIQEQKAQIKKMEEERETKCPTFMLFNKEENHGKEK